MLRTFVYAGKGHTSVTLPGDEAPTKVENGMGITVEFADPHVAHPGYARFLAINGFRETTGVESIDVQAVAARKKPGRRKKA